MSGAIAAGQLSLSVVLSFTLIYIPRQLNRLIFA
jgi:hypothetical protein